MDLIDGEIIDLASPGGEPRSGSEVEKFVSFELGGELCCVAASGVAEVVQPISTSAIPNSPAWLLGLAAHRGEPVAVIDPRIIAEPAFERSGKAKVLVFKNRPDEAQFALPVDSLHEMISVPAAEVVQAAADGLPIEIDLNGDPVRFIDHQRLFDGLRGGSR